MPTILKRGESYKITVSCGYDIRGKQIRRHLTWKPEPGMTERQIQKEVQRQAVLFEESCRMGNVMDGNIKLADFSDRWFVEYAEKQLKPRTLATYQTLLPRVLAAMGHIRLDKLKPAHLTAFYANLEEEGVRLDTTYKSRVDFHTVIPDTKTALAKAAGIGISTLDALMKGRNISQTTAEKLSAALQMPLDQLFEPVSRGKLSGKTLLHYHRFLSSMLETAVQWQMIPNNPCKRVKAPRTEHKEARYLDEKQAAEMIALLDNEPIQYRTIVLLLLNTGLRRGELCGLEWKDIDFEKGVLHVRRNSLYLPDRGLYDDTPKTAGSQRAMKLPANCIPMLKEYRAYQQQERLKLGDQWQDHDRLFTRWNGEPIYPDTLTSWFHKFIEKNDLPQVTIHSLRHTNASLLIAAGTDLRTVSARLGHSQTSTTANIYAHAIQSADAAAADTLEDILQPIRKKA